MAGLSRGGGMSAARPPCMAAQLRTALGCYMVRVHDLSALGALVAADRLPMPGMIVCLQRGNAAVFGVMAWIEDSQGGILFDEELDAQLFGTEVDEVERPPRCVTSAAREAAKR